LPLRPSASARRPLSAAPLSRPSDATVDFVTGPCPLLSLAFRIGTSAWEASRTERPTHSILIANADGIRQTQNVSGVAGASAVSRHLPRAGARVSALRATLVKPGVAHVGVAQDENECRRIPRLGGRARGAP